MIVGMRTRQTADHLVGVHIGGGTAAGLKNVDHELSVVIARCNRVRRLCDRVCQFRGQLPKLPVDSRGCAFNHSQCANESTRETQSADWKILDRSLRLSTVQRVGRDAYFAHRIALGAIVHEPRG